METCLYEVETSGRKYFYHARARHFWEAKYHCAQEHNGTLAVVKDTRELQEIILNYPTRKNCYSQYFRLGLVRAHGGEDYSWVDGSDFDPGFQRISGDGAAGNCSGVGLFVGPGAFDSRFTAVPCSTQLAFLCESGNQIATASPQASSENSNSGLVAGLVSLSLFVVILLFLGALFYKRRQKVRSQTSGVTIDVTERSPSNQHDGPYYSTVADQHVTDVNVISPPEYASIEDGLQSPPPCGYTVEPYSTLGGDEAEKPSTYAKVENKKNPPEKIEIIPEPGSSDVASPRYATIDDNFAPPSVGNSESQQPVDGGSIVYRTINQGDVYSVVNKKK